MEVSQAVGTVLAQIFADNAEHCSRRRAYLGPLVRPVRSILRGQTGTPE